ncbi:hypothetical protein F5Y19DRAFT_488413 [Xylariaceae sp. FL1651]|nr:hypothetical protein F5Y19DRAFT_488413 [Xylariaceae sp. FL1651]
MQRRTAAKNVSQTFIKRVEDTCNALHAVIVNAHQTWHLIGAAGSRRIQAYIPNAELALVNHCKYLVMQHFSMQCTFESPERIRLYSQQLSGFRFIQRLIRALRDILCAFRKCVQHLEANASKTKNYFNEAFEKHAKHRRPHPYGRNSKALARSFSSPLRRVTSVDYRDVDELMEATDTISWEDYVSQNLGNLDIWQGW